MGICPQCHKQQVGFVRTLFSLGDYPVMCLACGKYSHVSTPKYFTQLFLYLLALVAIGAGLAMQNWWPPALYCAALFSFAVWLGFFAPMIAVPTADATMRRGFAWLGVAVALIAVLAALALW